MYGADTKSPWQKNTGTCTHGADTKLPWQKNTGSCTHGADTKSPWQKTQGTVCMEQTQSHCDRKTLGAVIMGQNQRRQDTKATRTKKTVLFPHPHSLPSSHFQKKEEEHQEINEFYSFMPHQNKKINNIMFQSSNVICKKILLSYIWKVAHFTEMFKFLSGQSFEKVFYPPYFENTFLTWRQAIFSFHTDQTIKYFLTWRQAYFPLIVIKLSSIS